MPLHVTTTTLRRLSRPAIHQEYLRQIGRTDEVLTLAAPRLSNLEVSVRDPRSTTADDVMRELAEMQRRYASVTDCGGRAAEPGDAVVVDIVSHVDGATDESTRRTNVAIPLEENFPLRDLSRALVGARAGGIYVVSVDFPDDFDVACARGFRVTYSIKVRQVVRRELPAAEDETFLRALGVDPHGESLIENLWERVTRRRRQEEKRELSSAVFAELIRRAPPVEVPRELIDAQIRRHWMLIERPALSRWCFARSHIERAFMRWMAMGAEAERIEHDLHVGYLLEALARDLKIELTDDEAVEALTHIHSGAGASQGGAVVANGLDEVHHVARVILAAEHVMGYATVSHVDPLADTLEHTSPGRRVPPTSMESLG